MAVLEAFAEALLLRAAAPLPDEAVRETRRTLLNVVGTAIGASRTDEFDRLVSVAKRLGGSEIAVPGRTELVDRFYAALLIGFSAHFDDYDDTHLETVIHPGAATLAAWYAIGNAERVDPSLSLGAYAMGVESQLRVGLAMSPSHYDDGWHITGTCGVIGAAVAAGISMGLDARCLAAAIGLAAEMTIGHREAFGTPIKPFHAGKAAANGLFAAELARSGSSPTIDCFDSPNSYFSSLSHEYRLDLLDPGSVAGRLVLLHNTYKPYPCGIVAHPAIEAAVGLHGVVSSRIGEISEVLVDCNPLVPELMGRPDATTGLEARFSAIHGVAVGLLFGQGGLAEFSDQIAGDAAVRSLRGRTRLLPDPARARDSARVSVIMENGAVERFEVETAAGSLERPLSDEALYDKFASLVEPVLPGRAEAIAEVVRSVGEGSGPVELAEVCLPYPSQLLEKRGE